MERQENEGIEGKFSLAQTVGLLRGRRIDHVRQRMLRQDGHEIRENSAKRHQAAPLYESKDPGTALRDNRCAGGNVGGCMGGRKRKEFMDCIEKGEALYCIPHFLPARASHSETSTQMCRPEGI